MKFRRFQEIRCDQGWINIVIACVITSESPKLAFGAEEVF